jgi:hypothetical protein
MEQKEAREVARQLGGIAVTRDRFHSEWEKTHEWGVSLFGKWYGSVDEFPEPIRQAIGGGK